MPAQPTNVGPGKVEVVEVFWFGCPHCAALEPFIQSWLKNKPAYIEFVRVPVMWGPRIERMRSCSTRCVAMNRTDLGSEGLRCRSTNQHQIVRVAAMSETLKAQQAFAKANGVERG